MEKARARHFEGSYQRRLDRTLGTSGPVEVINDAVALSRPNVRTGSPTT